jgi:hypothetical protein
MALISLAQIVSSSCYNVHTHLRSREMFIFLVLSKLRPPMSIGMQIVGQFTRWYFHFEPEPS